MSYMLVILSTVLLAVKFAVSNKYQKLQGTGIESGMVFSIGEGLVTALAFGAMSGFRIEFSAFSLLLAFGVALAGACYQLIGFWIMKTENMTVYSLALMSGGMLLPYLFGVFFLDEKLTVLRVLGLLMVLAAVILSNRSKEPVKITSCIACAAIFILNGIVSILSKCHQINTVYFTVSSESFVMYSGIGKFIFGLLVLPFLKTADKKVLLPGIKIWGLIACSAVLGGVSYMLQLIGAKNLPATVLYPLITGGSIIFSCCIDAFVFKKKPSIWQTVGVVLCSAGTLLFL